MSAPLLTILAFMIGLSAVVLARYLRFNFGVDTVTGETADTMMLADIGIGVAIGILVKIVLRIRSPKYYSAMIVGVLLSVVMMHNVVHSSPELFRTYFSPEWTQMVVENTKPNSVLFRGESYSAQDMSSGQVAGEGAQSNEAAEPAEVKVNQLPQVR
ncbi:hypothetical protein SAMN04488030_1196 [Aliiroseovarius halocynthiae]|uniref:Uncharacterized protein n=1 Tax=Aliiroseovarius halocynthiae TaxID=985055 RepID=A0A545SVX0_9RHOB|nr:hypothetical protein [Aliiroseovarius halocynthiae]TQV69104.1 hypothetical protein FIL88_05920 [Aliiroseovarius halocynthiae]SMR71861.1 hypothetical protein SAMN04488030_1196 [Aliiroseovarius halocynthiae]